MLQLELGDVGHKLQFYGNCCKMYLMLTGIFKENKLYWGYMWPTMHKPTIHRKISKSSFSHHPVTELLLITTMFFFSQYNLLSSSYTTVSVIQLKMYISTNVRFHFRIRTPFTKSPRTNRFFSTYAYGVRGPNFARLCVAWGRCHLWRNSKIDEMRPVGYWRVLKIYILQLMVGLCIDGNIYETCMIVTH